MAEGVRIRLDAVSTRKLLTVLFSFAGSLHTDGNRSFRKPEWLRDSVQQDD